jgi:putative DNA primase/helicase
MNEATEPEAPAPEDVKRPAAEILPEEEAKRFLATTEKDGHPRLVFWQDAWWYWARGRYREITGSEIRSKVSTFLNRSYFKVGQQAIGNTLDQLQSQSLIAYSIDPPAWLTGRNEWAPRDILVCRNKLLHLPSWIAGKPYTTTPTPTLFSISGLDFHFDENAPEPKRWFRFLTELWDADSEAREALQLWFGYCLTPNTQQQKFLSLFGPKRSGKGTIIRVLTALVGKDNVAAPTLSSFSTNFGLWPLVGKMLAVISDARLSGRADSAVIVERILSITGEDAITVDRKFAAPVTTTFPTRIMLVSNELPRLPDASGALVSRMIVLPLTKTWFGHEDKDLTQDLLAELPGILWWSMDGWRRLQTRGELLQPASGAEMLTELEEIGSPIGTFVRDRCTVAPDLTIPRQDLYAAYQVWSEERGRRHTEDAAGFGRGLRAVVPSLRSTQPRVEGKQTRLYAGIGLRSSDW